MPQVSNLSFSLALITRRLRLLQPQPPLSARLQGQVLGLAADQEEEEEPAQAQGTWEGRQQTCRGVSFSMCKPRTAERGCSSVSTFLPQQLLQQGLSATGCTWLLAHEGLPLH
jgi:hypothetical protein